MKEVWKDFVLGNKEYSVSSNGKIYGYSKGDFIISRLDTDGYPVVTLGSDKKRRVVRIHRLVALNFVYSQDPKNQNEVNHIDFDRTNNQYLNLEWCTHSQNIQYSIDANRMVFQTTDIRGDKNPNYGNRKLSKIYSEDSQYAKEKQGRPGSKNGRCVPIKMISESGETMEFSYLRECAEYIENRKFSKNKKETISNSIVRAIKENKKYLGFSFSYL